MSLGPKLAQAGFKDEPVLLIDTDRPLWGIKARARDPLELWQKYREKFDILGYWPLILTEDESSLRLLEEGLEGFGDGAPEIEPLLDLLDGPGALQYLQDEFEGEEPEEGDWPSLSLPGNNFSIRGKGGLLSIFRGRDVTLALLPAKEPWEVFAYLNYGGWNECPGPSVHVAIHRMWNNKWGAEPVTVSHDIIECRVEKPPSSKEQAMELAREQYKYCPDIVDQGVETISALASTLKDGRVWYFWWD